MDGKKVFGIIQRYAVDIFSEGGLREKLLGGERLKIKFGADPSRPDLHLGHTVPLRMLRLLQISGHEIIFVIGDFTGMIGDPSGRSKTRPPLTFEETRENGRSYFEQVSKILDPEKTRITYNSTWLSGMSLGDVLTLQGKYTLARILERDDFAKRFNDRQAIGLHELMYPLMQGYDSVALNADVEVGGTDQTFNLLVGRDLQRDYGQMPQEVITFPLLPGLDGVNKMSKSLGNYIGICEEAGIMFEKCMKVPDELLTDYFRLTTDVPSEEYSRLTGGDIRMAHFAYAEKIVEMYHGPELADRAKRRYLSIAGGDMPDDMPCIAICESGVKVVEVICRAGFASSNSEARRLIRGGAVKTGGEMVTDENMIITDATVLRCGKNRFVRVHFD